MSDRVKCLHCDHMILEVTARLNGGLCGSCHMTQSKSDHDKIVQGWVANPETLPGTNGIPEPKDIALRIAAAQVRSLLFPTEEDKMEDACHQVVGQAEEIYLMDGAESLTERQKYALAVETFYGEVCNGGLSQYLVNESGAYANWAADGFRAIGIPEFAQIAARVQALFPEGLVPEDHEARLDIVKELDDAVLEEIEKPFWERYFADKSEIRRKLYAYLTTSGG